MLEKQFNLINNLEKKLKKIKKFLSEIKKYIENNGISKNIYIYYSRAHEKIIIECIDDKELKLLKEVRKMLKNIFPCYKDKLTSGFFVLNRYYIRYTPVNNISDIFNSIDLVYSYNDDIPKSILKEKCKFVDKYNDDKYKVLVCEK
jgi:hypothetical protein